MGLEQGLTNQPPSGNWNTKVFNQAYEGYKLGNEFSKYKPPYKPPSAPPSRPPSAPPSRPPSRPPSSPPGGGKLGGAAKGLAGYMGAEIGSNFSKKILNDFFGQSPNIVGPQQEQQALDRHQNPPSDKEIGTPPFIGGQNPSGTYRVTWVTKWQNENSGVVKIYARLEMPGRVTSNPNPDEATLLGGNNPENMVRRPYAITANGSRNYGYNYVYLGCDGQPQSGNNTFVGISLIDIVTLSDPSPLDNAPPIGTPPGIVSPGISGGIGPVTSPLTTPGVPPLAPPGNPPLAPPGTKPGDNKDENKAPGRGPGDIYLPNSFEPFIGTKPTNGPDTIRMPNITPGRTPGIAPGSHTTRQNTGKPTYFDEKTPGATEKKNPFPPTLLPPLFMPPGIDRKNGENTNFAPAPKPTEPSPNTQPSESCKCNLPLQQKLERQDAKLDQLIAYDIALDTAQLSKLDTVLARLGPQVTGGLSGFLGDKFTKLWNSKALDRALTLLNLAASLHNAVMLSRNLVATLTLTITNILALIGIKDPDGTAFGLEQLLSSTVENLLKGIIGAENYTELTETWKKANRIYQAAINVHQLLTDSLYSISEGLELLGEYNGKIGNALKKSGTVLDSAYSWMNEKFNFKSKKNRTIDKVIKGLQDATEIASDLAEITSEFREAQENITEIGNQVNLLKTELKTETDAKKVKEKDSHDNSQTPDIPKSAMIQPPPAPAS